MSHQADFNPSNYNPSATEWVALVAAFTAVQRVGHSLTDIGIASNWRIYWGHEGWKKPGYVLPEVYAFCRYFCSLIIAIGWWLPWREAYRSQFVVSATDQGVGTPSNHYFFMLNLSFLILIWLGGNFGYSFFVIGIEGGWMCIAFFHELALFVCVSGVLVYGWLIWMTIWRIMLVPGVFYLISMVIMLQFWMKESKSKKGRNDPRFVFHLYNTVIGSQKGSKSREFAKEVIRENGYQLAGPGAFALETVDAGSSQPRSQARPTVKF